MLELIVAQLDQAQSMLRQCVTPPLVIDGALLPSAYSRNRGAPVEERYSLGMLPFTVLHHELERRIVPVHGEHCPSAAGARVAAQKLKTMPS